MKPFKRFVQISLGIVLCYVILNIVIWEGCTKDLLTYKRYFAGDLGRLSYLIGSKYYRKETDTLPRRHMENTEYRGQRVDVLTIGDSVSYGFGGGENRYYQDWMATLDNIDVLNFPRYKDKDYTPFETVLILLNSGYLDKIKPRYIMIESIERFVLYWYEHDLNFALNDSLPNVEGYYRTFTPRINAPEVGFLNWGNMKCLINPILYRFSDNAFFSRVYARELDYPYFSVKDGRRLLFFDQDLENLPLATEVNVKKINDNFNHLAEILAKKNIKLVFMPVVDKYDFYASHIVNNPYPHNAFFERIRKLEKRYMFIDTKALLAGELERREKDIYFADDTHWTWKASKKVFETVRFD